MFLGRLNVYFLSLMFGCFLSLLQDRLPGSGPDGQRHRLQPAEDGPRGHRVEPHSREGTGVKLTGVSLSQRRAD